MVRYVDNVQSGLGMETRRRFLFFVAWIMCAWLTVRGTFYDDASRKTSVRFLCHYPSRNLCAVPLDRRSRVYHLFNKTSSLVKSGYFGM